MSYCGLLKTVTSFVMSIIRGLDKWHYWSEEDIFISKVVGKKTQHLFCSKTAMAEDGYVFTAEKSPNCSLHHSTTY